MDINLVHQLKEDVFKKADADTLAQRDADKAKAHAAQIAKFKKERGKVLDICPKCFNDLREIGVNQSYTVDGDAPIEYSEGNWVEGEFQGDNYDSNGYQCPECYADLERGKDFDARWK